MTTVVFSHGQESGPWGTKIRAMADLAHDKRCDVVSVDYRGIDDPTERVRKLIAEAGAIDDQLVLVGSSMGGHVATAAAAALKAAGLFVLAPAFFMEGYESLTPDPPNVPIFIVHGWHDDIVPPENSIRYARQCSATLHLVDGDHRLTANIDDIKHQLSQFIDSLGAA